MKRVSKSCRRNLEIEDVGGRLASIDKPVRKMKAPHALVAAAMCAASLLLIAQHTQGATTVSVVRDSRSPVKQSPRAPGAPGPAGGRPPTPHPPTPS